MIFANFCIGRMGYIATSKRGVFEIILSQNGSWPSLFRNPRIMGCLDVMFLHVLATHCHYTCMSNNENQSLRVGPNTIIILNHGYG